MLLYEKNKYNNIVDEMIDNLKKISKRKTDEDLKRIEKKISTEVDIKSDLILKQIYLEMRTNLFKKYPFDDNIKNQNLFDDLSLRSRILTECKFEISGQRIHNEILKQRNVTFKNLDKISIAGGMVGVIWTVVQGTVLPLSLVVASILVYKLNKNITKKERERSINIFFENLRRNFQIWLENIEKYFIKEVKKAFPDFN